MNDVVRKQQTTISRDKLILTSVAIAAQALFVATPVMALEEASVVELTPADESAAAPVTSQSANRFMEEVVVTAQKREENLQDVPISVSAFSAETLSAKGITNPTDLQLVTPGLNYTSLANYSIIYLRGVGTDAFIPSADGSVATYIDGIYFPFASGLAQSFGALERIEVLKGPQGTLFGRNSTGGAINIITKKPSFDFENSIEMSYADYNQIKAKVYSNIPLGDTLAFNVSVIYNNEDNYYKSSFRALPQENSRGARLKLRWQPTENLDVTIGALRLITSGVSTILGGQVSPKPVLVALGQGTPDPAYKVSNDAPTLAAANNSVLYGDGKWMMPWFDLRLLAGNQRIRTDGLVDYDATKLPLVSFRQSGGFADIRTAELQLLSNKDSWGSEWLTYIGGLYYINSDAGYNPVDLYVGFHDANALPVVGQQALGQIINPLLNPLLDQLSSLLPTPVDPVTVRIRGILHTDSTAAFFQSTGKVTDWLSITAGGRYQKEARKLTKATVGTPDFDSLISYAAQSTDTSNFSPKISIDVRPADDVLTYLSYSKGFKSGTYNIISIYTQPGYVKPEQVGTIELGIKSEFLSRSLRFNAAVFQNDIKDVQVQVISLASGGAVAFENAGKARIRGFDSDVTWQLFPETLPGLVATASATYLNAIYTDYPQGSGYDETTGLFFGPNSLVPAVTPGRDYSGHRVVQAPRWSGTSGLGYTFEMGAGTLEIAGDIYFNEGFFYTAQNSPRAEQDPYHVINARISYLYDPWRLRVTAFGRNINEAHYYYYNFETDFGTSGLLQPPAMYGLRVNWDF